MLALPCWLAPPSLQLHSPHWFGRLLVWWYWLVWYWLGLLWRYCVWSLPLVQCNWWHWSYWFVCWLVVGECKNVIAHGPRNSWCRMEKQWHRGRKERQPVASPGLLNELGCRRCDLIVSQDEQLLSGKVGSGRCLQANDRHRNSDLSQQQQLLCGQAGSGCSLQANGRRRNSDLLQQQQLLCGQVGSGCSLQANGRRCNSDLSQ
jgi:hypothetical protein